MPRRKGGELIVETEQRTFSNSIPIFSEKEDIERLDIRSYLLHGYTKKDVHSNEVPLNYVLINRASSSNMVMISFGYVVYLRERSSIVI